MCLSQQWNYQVLLCRFCFTPSGKGCVYHNNRIIRYISVKQIQPTLNTKNSEILNMFQFLLFYCNSADGMVRISLRIF